MIQEQIREEYEKVIEKILQRRDRLQEEIKIAKKYNGDVSKANFELGILQPIISDFMQIFIKIDEQKIKNKKKKIKRKTNDIYLHNNITEKLEYLHVSFKKKAIKEIIYALNENYKTYFTRDSVNKFLKNILEKYNHSKQTMIYGYLKYLLEDGMLIKKQDGTFEIKTTTLIPKRKKENDLGILNELEMS